MAGLDGLDAGLGDGGLQQRNVGLFAGANAEQIGDLLLGEAEGGKVGRGEFGEALLIECSLEPLEREGTEMLGWVYEAEKPNKESEMKWM